MFICHEVYGQLRAELSVDSRKKAAEFVKGIQGGKSSPLKNITSGYHYHTVLADSEHNREYRKRGREICANSSLRVM